MRRQDRPCWSDAGQGQTSLLTSRLLRCDCPLLGPYSSLFPRFFLPRPPLPLPFPACGVSLKHPMVSFAQFQNAFPLQCIMCPVLLTQWFSLWGATEAHSHLADYIISLYNIADLEPDKAQQEMEVSVPFRFLCQYSVILTPKMLVCMFSAALKLLDLACIWHCDSLLCISW